MIRASQLVAVKKLKSDAPNATKEAFEKEVNFMSRLTYKNVIRILGVCYEDMYCIDMIVCCVFMLLYACVVVSTCLFSNVLYIYLCINSSQYVLFGV